MSKKVSHQPVEANPPADNTSRWMRRMLLSVVFVCPLLFVLTLQDTFDLPKMISVYAAAAGLLLLWLWHSIARGQWVWRSSDLDRPLMLFLVVTAASAIISIERPLSLWGGYRTYVFALWPTTAFAVVYWMTRQMDTDGLGDPLQRLIVWSGALAGFYGVMQYSGWEIFDAMPKVEGGRVWSSLGNPVYFGALCAMALPVALARCVGAATSYKRWENGTAAIFILGGLLLSLSRGAWVGAAAAAIFIFWRYKKAPMYLLLLFMGMALALPSVRHRARILFSTGEGSNASRLAGWQGGIRVALDHPWFGTGPDTFTRAFRAYRSQDYIAASGTGVTQAHAHNDFVQVAATEGFVGLAMFLWVWLAAARGAFRTSTENAGLAGGLIALAIQNQFNFSSVATSLWAAAALAVVMPAAAVHRAVRPSSAAIRRFAAVPLAGASVLVAWRLWIPVAADAAYQRSRALLQEQQTAEALNEIRFAVLKMPSIELYETERANVAKTLAQLEAPGPQQEALVQEAWSAAQDAVRRHPHNPDSWNNEGVAAMWLTQLFHENHSADAQEAFRRAAELDPFFVDAWANLAKCEHLAGRLDLEKDLWRRVIKIDAAHPMARQVLGL